MADELLGSVSNIRKLKILNIHVSLVSLPCWKMDQYNMKGTSGQFLKDLFVLQRQNDRETHTHWGGDGVRQTDGPGHSIF